jgi:hypothetical protein
MLVLFDSFKLVRKQYILITIVMGCLTALLSLVVNLILIQKSGLAQETYVRYIAPLVEESAKALYIIYLFRRKKIGFMIDAAIYGFAAGAGFAFVENVYYLHSIDNPMLIVWIIRGLGTAIMHGGTTAILAIISKNMQDRHGSGSLVTYFPGLVIAIIIHSFFNHFFFRPILMTLGQLILLPAIVAFVFLRSERNLRTWLEVGLDSDVTVLEYIKSGKISETKIGLYLQSLMDQFPGEIVADMLCYLQIYLELSICAKGALLMQESGFKVPLSNDIREKITELSYLEKSLGPTGKLAIMPLVQRSDSDLWQLYLLND